MSAPPTRGPAGAGDRIGGYVVRGVLGRGAQGFVYLAEPVTGESRVALKVLRSDANERARARFTREAKAAASIDHEGVVRVLDAGEERGLLWYAMELVDARSLERRIVEEGPLEARDAARLVASIARSLHAAHDKNVLHRDLKPSNVLLVGGALEKPKLADFGLALVLGGTRLTETGAFLGTPCYAAPEVVLGSEGSPSQDVYGLGAILYECLVGRPPFMGPSLGAILEKVVKERPPKPGRTRFVPPALERLCLRCLEKSPGHRPSTALEVALALEHFLGERRADVAETARAGLARLSSLARASALVVLGLILGLEAGLLVGLHYGLLRP